MGLRRPPQPDPPRQPTGNQLLLLLRLLLRPLPLPLRVQGAALPSNTPSCTMRPTPPGRRLDVEQAVFRSLRT
ncbi:hypothetical protein CR919_07605 [Stenotrophomonas sp. LMG 10879]|nr:hypothetical protein CR919_07605 [Stenotrophomonas sp. LMG 10879]